MATFPDLFASPAWTTHHDPALADLETLLTEELCAAELGERSVDGLADLLSATLRNYQRCVTRQAQKDGTSTATPQQQAVAARAARDVARMPALAARCQRSVADYRQALAA